ncbi:VPLPA-CTERM sorting domain-containing protein [Roseisalinus antarcticus]|uniref:PEP-CTERM protein-sorting domain-containing protein n=1 Tax=Roseisalinus antarcticus TaxID=254357 RepID=A0A1Y5RKH3_9RHOB|nr:VPLPA-CTERM sorting domain-containing protein [Roseisalinus antarcticus]SLN19590.1 hypothetical protein ROA7023_00466 [Roseisalinus antarcticus]
MKRQKAVARHVRACAIVSALAIGAFTAQSVQAATYEYTGATFSSNFAPYDTSMNISGAFDVASPLSSSMSLTDISGSLTSFSFFTGVRTFETGDDVNNFSLATDVTGAIVGWEINIDDNAWYVSMSSSSSPKDRTRNMGPGGGDAYNYTAGSWAIAPVPLPAGFWFLMAALGGLVVLAQRRRVVLPTALENAGGFGQPS